MPEDRPTIEQIENDTQFDNWLIDYERKIAQRTSKYSHKV